jgi:predicted transcriptional regulator
MIDQKKAMGIVSRLKQKDYRVADIAEEFGVSYSCVYGILAGRTWSDITDHGRVFSARRKRPRVEPGDAARMRALHARGTTQADIAEAFGVSTACVSRIVNNITHQLV